MSEHDSLARRLRQGVSELGLDIEDARQRKLLDYLALLRKWNSAYNLSGIRDPQRMLGLHLLDSLTVLPHLRGDHCLDVGTGGGLPGIPLAICRPDMAFTLLDSNGKKTRFLVQAVATLGLDNVTVVNQRVESFQSERRIAIVVTRAFSSLRQSLEWCSHLLDAEGRLLAMKGQYPADEIADLPPRFRLLAAHETAIPGEDASRHLLEIGRRD